jgi:hypothetical protein
MEFRLFEALSKCKLFLKDSEVSQDKLDKKPHVGEAEYEVHYLNEKLQKYNTGWTKYTLFVFPKVHSTNNKFIKVSSILHLIHALEPDIIIARVVKYSQKTKNINIRYIIYQGNREQICSNLRELYLTMCRTYNYEGRVLTADDFKKENK